jgi:hypothetical protein
MLNDAGITAQEQEQNRKTIVEVMQFYQERDLADTDKVWQKMNNANAAEEEAAPVDQKKPVIPSRPPHTLSVYSTDIKKGTLLRHFLLSFTIL